MQGDFATLEKEAQKARANKTRLTGVPPWLPASTTCMTVPSPTCRGKESRQDMLPSINSMGLPI
jgi:hypothetical protein